MMINKKVILLAPFKYYYKNRLSKYIEIGSTTGSELYYYKPLQKIFTNVIGYDYLKRLPEIGITGINEEVIDLVKKEHPDYVIWASGGCDFQGLTFDSIRKEGALVIGCFYDDEYCFDSYSKWWIPYLDYCVTGDIEVVSKYKEIGAKPICSMPGVGGTAIDQDWSKIKEKYTVSFIGNKGHDREKYINELKKRNIPVYLVGGDRGKGYISMKEMLDVHWSSKINLNFSKTGHSNKLAIKGRMFEICLAGGFLLTEYAPGVENYFEINKEIACFRNPEEMIDKIDYYLNHNEERRAIAKAGWEKAMANYTCFHVLSRVFKEIEEDIGTGSKKDDSCFLKLKKKPRKVRENFSDYYFTLGLAFAMVGDKKLCKDALSLSLSYNLFNIRTWYCYFIGFSPPFMRPILFKVYKIINNTLVKCLIFIRDLGKNK